MSTGVFGQVVAAHEAGEARRTHEPFLPRVRPLVSGQFVRAAEASLASVPLALEGLLALGDTGVGPSYMLHPPLPGARMVTYPCAS